VAGAPEQLETKEGDFPASLVEVFSASDPLQAELVAATLRDEGLEPIIRMRLLSGLTLTPTETHWVPGQQSIVFVPTIAEPQARDAIAALGPLDADVSDFDDGPIGPEPDPTRRRISRARVLAGIVLAPSLLALLFGVSSVLVELFARKSDRAPSNKNTLAVETARQREAACTRGNLRACVDLGVSCDKGDGVSVDHKRAAELYRRGCEAGIVIGCVNLGLSYQTGSGVVVNVAEAKRLYRMGCDDGFIPGCYNLAVVCQGEADARSLDEAVRLYRQTCEAEYVAGCLSLGNCYRKGLGIASDPREAARLYSVACDGGVMVGCYNLAVSYHRGEGVDRDGAEAARLYRKSCQGGFAEACAFATQ